MPVHLYDGSSTHQCPPCAAACHLASPYITLPACLSACLSACLPAYGGRDGCFGYTHLGFGGEKARGEWGGSQSVFKEVALKKKTRGYKQEQSGTIGHNQIQSGTIGHNQTQPGTVGRNQTQPGTAGHNQTQPGTIGHNQTQPGTSILFI